MNKLAMLALGFTLVGGTTAYANHVALIEGDFDKGQVVTGEGQGAEDRYVVRCSVPDQICAEVDSVGFFDDNILKETLKCKSPSQSGTQRSTLVPPGSTGFVCVDNCSKAQLNISCTNDSPFCDEAYVATVVCTGGADISVEQTQDQ
jgi:hypothetical protein